MNNLKKVALTTTATLQELRSLVPMKCMRTPLQHPLHLLNKRKYKLLINRHRARLTRLKLRPMTLSKR